MHAGTLQDDRQAAVAGKARCGDLPRAAVDEEVFENVQAEVQQGVVEHQRGDHLIGIEARAQYAGDEAHQRAHQRACQHRHDQSDKWRERKTCRHRRARQPAKEARAFGGHIEHRGLKHDTYRDAGVADCGGSGEYVADLALGGQGAHQKLINGVAGVAAHRIDQNQGQNQGNTRRDQGGDGIEGSVAMPGKQEVGKTAGRTAGGCFIHSKPS